MTRNSDEAMFEPDEQHCIDKCAVLTAKAATHDETKMI
jgi:hypothetical protein